MSGTLLVGLSTRKGLYYCREGSCKEKRKKKGNSGDVGMLAGLLKTPGAISDRLKYFPKKRMKGEEEGGTKRGPFGGAGLYHLIIRR